MNPLHVANTVLEPMRNRYNFKDKTYAQIVNLNRGDDAGPSIIQTLEGAYAVDELLFELKKLATDWKNSPAARNSEYVLQPLFWENRVDELIFEEDLFTLLKD